MEEVNGRVPLMLIVQFLFSEIDFLEAPPSYKLIKILSLPECFFKETYKKSFAKGKIPSAFN